MHPPAAALGLNYTKVAIMVRIRHAMLDTQHLNEHRPKVIAKVV